MKNNENSKAEKTVTKAEKTPRVKRVATKSPAKKKTLELRQNSTPVEPIVPTPTEVVTETKVKVKTKAPKQLTKAELSKQLGEARSTVETSENSLKATGAALLKTQEELKAKTKELRSKNAEIKSLKSENEIAHISFSKVQSIKEQQDLRIVEVSDELETTRKELEVFAKEAEENVEKYEASLQAFKQIAELEQDSLHKRIGILEEHLKQTVSSYNQQLSELNTLLTNRREALERMENVLNTDDVLVVLQRWYAHLDESKKSKAAFLVLFAVCALLIVFASFGLGSMALLAQNKVAFFVTSGISFIALLAFLIYAAMKIVSPQAKGE